MSINELAQAAAGLEAVTTAAIEPTSHAKPSAPAAPIPQHTEEHCR